MTNSEMCCVVGSGPAGISCAQALIDAGRQVTILDSGVQLEVERRNAVTSLASTDPSGWTPVTTAFLREGMKAGTSGIPIKVSYGSDFPWRQVPGAPSITYDGAYTRPSYARGGLSTVWGGAVLPYRQEDMADWPITIADLEPGYRAALGMMPLSARKDDLSELFPIYADRYAPLPMSRQATAVLAGLEHSREKLNAHGVHFGSSRLTVHASDSDGKPLCVQCGLCLYGCPHSLIYSTDQTLAKLLATDQVCYKPGVTVQSFEEKASGVVIRGIDLQEKPVEFRASRVFLAAGTLNTTVILLRSLEQFDMPVPIRDSPYFVVPLLRFRGTPDVVREPLHTLSQLFLEVIDSAISPHTIHLQTYTYNDLFIEPILATLGPLRKAFPLERFLGSLLLFNGHFHSCHSASISATLRREGQGDALRIQAVPNLETERRLSNLVGKFTKLVRETGFIPLRPMMQLAMPLRSFHYGGSFPMSASPGAQETDILGRPGGLRRVHAVDSTVLPSIAATTITLTEMANAYRIGRQCALDADTRGE
jgi:hypothetical protein